MIQTYNRARRIAKEYARTVDLERFTHDELCEMYCNLNSKSWDERLGEVPNDIKPKYYWVRSMQIMQRITDIVGDKATSKWWNVVHTKNMSEDEYEEWYDKLIQKSVLGIPF